MNNQEVVALLQDCKRALTAPPSEPSEQDMTEYRQCEASLSADLRTLLEQAKEMKWPFVPERWQYKHEVCPEDKTNLKDIISEKLPDLLVFLKASISVGDYASAAATVFLIDRFLYWVDASSKLLQIAKGLHRRCHEIPIAPQVVIRQARVSVNSGKLLKAEYILSSLINNSGATGTWVYEKMSDRTLVQAVSIQIRGQILQKLGLWYEAAELTWASIVGFYELPQPDKKGISTSLGILADVLVSMSDDDYIRFKDNPQMDLILLEEYTDRLLSAAEAGKLAAVLSQYSPLFVLTNLNIYGTCLLSYSFKKELTEDERQFYLSQAKEAFEIGLLTRRGGEVITSKQELHGFVKAAFSLTTVCRWLTDQNANLTEARQLCKEAMKKLYLYSTQTQEALAQEIMELIGQVKVHLQIKDLCNSDIKSYVPDHYKHYWDKPIVKGRMTFEKVLERHTQYHTTICKVFERTCRRQQNSKESLAHSCITAFKTETKEFDTADAKMSTLHSVDRNLLQDPLLKQVMTSKDNKTLQSQSNQLLNAGKSEKEHVDCLKNNGAPDDCLIGDPSYVLIDAETELDDITTEEKGNTDKGGTEYLNDSHGSSNSCFKTSRSGSSNIWKEETGGKGSGLPEFGRKQFLFKLDTECSTTLSDDVDSKNGELNNSALKSIIPPVQQLSLQYTQVNNPSITSNINCTPSNGRQKNPSSSALGDHASCSVDPDEETADDIEDNKTDSYCKITRSDQSPSAVSHPNYSTRYQTFRFDSDSKSNRKITSLTSEDSGSFEVVDSDADTADDMNNDGNKALPISKKYESVKSPSLQPASDTTNPASVGSNNSLNITKKSLSSSEEGGSFVMIEIDPTAETVDGTEDNNDPPSTGGVSEIEHIHLDESKKQEVCDHDVKQMKISSTQCSLPKKESDEGFEKVSLEEGESEGDRLSNQFLNSSLNSSTSLKSWYKSPFFSSNCSDFDYISPSVSSSSSSFVFLSRKKQTFERRVITDEDYKMLFAGVTHEWLIERIAGTGVFYPQKLKDTCTALQFKYSKKTNTWTAQETLVYIGKPLDVDKVGAQRIALEMRFLHQEEILGRYVGKQYKRTKELAYHFNDVERQMTAQYYVTEFNKRLYEKQVPTQIYYIPASVLLLLEDMQIMGCVSVEPYMLGEFIKLTNNTKTVRKEYEATMYGLAFGHFTYEFSNQEEIVVDLQGWITGDGKGLIYLTDPQIHSMKKRRGGSNFAEKGIKYFLNCQHKECNEICHILTLKILTRDSLDELP
ncbi:alpha-protein kinase 1 isoform X1 [Rhincodon typus]|uniref:alpha-protein kinase 1 isoform X1 n=2 Tax=Rhincodon typus TaxID=259920 RepID=UPI002030BDF3|nr:alpha-protein kinase 1 isoform X1 [Rhincodon typus]